MLNVGDLRMCRLWPAVAEAIVEFKTTELGRSPDPDLRDAGGGDLVFYKDKRFAAKQPGSYFWIAVPYVFFHAAGMKYAQDYDVVAAWTTWLSGGLVAAVGVGVFYLLLLHLGCSSVLSSSLALTYGLGTTLFPFTGVAHHDVFATSFLILVLYLLWTRRSQTDERLAKAKMFCVGLLLGLIIFTSMLPAFFVLSIAILIAMEFRWKETALAALGAFVGVLPLAAYNWINFDNPLRQANVVGNFKDTFFTPSMAYVEKHLWDYFGSGGWMSATRYMPIMAMGMASMLFVRLAPRWKWTMIVGVLLHFGYILNIDSVGHCQYGPRYLIPVLPFAFIGLGLLIQQRQGWLKDVIASLAIALGAYSIAVNTIGAFGNSVHCRLDHFGPTLYMQEWTKYWNDGTVLRLPSGILFSISIVLLIIFLRTSKPKSSRIL